MYKRQLYYSAYQDWHTGSNSPQDTARMVGYSFHSAVFYAVRVVVLAAPHFSGSKAFAELHAFDGGDSKNQGREHVFHAAKHGGPQAGGNPYRRALHDPAHTVQRYV